MSVFPTYHNDNCNNPFLEFCSNTVPVQSSVSNPLTRVILFNLGIRVETMKYHHIHFVVYSILITEIVSFTQIQQAHPTLHAKELKSLQTENKKYDVVQPTVRTYYEPGWLVSWTLKIY
jgi:hypothetical protein